MFFLDIRIPLQIIVWKFNFLTSIWAYNLELHMRLKRGCSFLSYVHSKHGRVVRSPIRINFFFKSTDQNLARALTRWSWKSPKKSPVLPWICVTLGEFHLHFGWNFSASISGWGEKDFLTEKMCYFFYPIFELWGDAKAVWVIRDENQLPEKNRCIFWFHIHFDIVGTQGQVEIYLLLWHGFLFAEMFTSSNWQSLILGCECLERKRTTKWPLEKKKEKIWKVKDERKVLTNKNLRKKWAVNNQRKSHFFAPWHSVLFHMEER